MSFPSIATFRTGASFPVASASTPPPDVTNAQKLSLSPSTPVGTKVSVSDGVFVSGAGYERVNTLFITDGMSNGKPYYETANNSDDNSNVQLAWLSADDLSDGSGLPGWQFYDVTTDNVYLSHDDVAFPWLVTTWINANAGVDPKPILTHPAIQQLMAPSAAQSGVFVLGATGDASFANSIWENSNDPRNGKDSFIVLGQVDESSSFLSYESASSPVPGGWTLRNSAEGDILYNSTYEQGVLGLPTSLTNGQACRIRYSSVLDLTIELASDATLAASDNSQSGSDASITIGISDSPTKAQVAAKIASLASFSNFPFISAASSGAQVVFKNTYTSAMGFSFPESPTGDWSIVSATFVPQNVSTPDQVITWYDTSNLGAIASITVTSVSVGELNAGATLAGAGTSASNGVIPGPTKSGSDPGTRELGDVTNLNALSAFWDGVDLWEIGNPNAGRYSSSQNKAFPWQITNLAPDDGIAPAPTVTRNDVATEANWSPDITSPQTFFPAPPIHF